MHKPQPVFDPRLLSEKLLVSSGVCHSDLSAQNGTIPAGTPCVLGHEGAGIVEEVGAGISEVAVGDHVILSFTPACRKCKPCLCGQSNLCDTMISMAVTPHFVVDGKKISGMTGCGTFAEEMIVPDAAVVKVSGRKGLGVKADDLIDALIAKARTEIEARDPEREPAARDAAARDVAVGALRYFMARFSRTTIITFDMDQALAFVGETGPYVQNAVVRARNIFAKLEAQGHDVPALVEKGRNEPLAELLAGEEGDEIWALLMLMACSEEVAEQVVRSEAS